MKTIFIKILGTVFIVGFIAYTAILIRIFPELYNELRFQDLFAGITAFLSGLAFLGVIIAIILQKDELQLQREELKLTRTELKRTAQAQEKSEEALSKQASSLKVTAKLNGLSARLQHYNSLLEMTNSAKYGIDEAKYRAHKKDAHEVIEEIKKLIED